MTASEILGCCVFKDNSLYANIAILDRARHLAIPVGSRRQLRKSIVTICS